MSLLNLPSRLDAPDAPGVQEVPLKLGRPKVNLGSGPTAQSFEPAAKPEPTPTGQGSVFSKGKDNAEEAYTAWQADRNPQTTGQLLRVLRPTIESSVRRHTGGVDPLAVGQAKQLVLKSLPRYDAKQASLKTYVDRQVQPIVRWQSRRRRTVRTPDRAQMDLLRLLDIEKELTSETGRSPSTLQLADQSGLSVRRIEQLRSMDTREVAGSRSLGEDDDSTVDDLAARDDAAAYRSWIRFVRTDLGDIDQAILEHTMGLDGAKKLSNQDLARKLKLSPGAISQRKLRIQRLIDRETELSPFR